LNYLYFLKKHIIYDVLFYGSHDGTVIGKEWEDYRTFDWQVEYPAYAVVTADLREIIAL
jgi:hypothetical protein